MEQQTNPTSKLPGGAPLGNSGAGEELMTVTASTYRLTMGQALY